VFALPKIIAGSPVAPTSYWFQPGTVTKAIRLNGINVASYALSIVAGGASANLNESQNIKTARVRLSGTSQTGPIEEAGDFLFSRNSIQQISSTTNCAAGNVGGKLCLLWQSYYNFVVLNNTAQTLDVVVTVEWM
jgi:hypothetical protein